MARLTTEVEAHMEERLRSFDRAFEKTSDAIDGLEPRIETAMLGISNLEGMITSKLSRLVQVSPRSYTFHVTKLM